jgi:hypothetical protein
MEIDITRLDEYEKEIDRTFGYLTELLWGVDKKISSQQWSVVIYCRLLEIEKQLAEINKNLAYKESL